MKANEEKIIDELASKAIKKADVKTPSADFTQSLMDKIQAVQTTQKTIVYEPLISKKIWAVIIAAIGSLIGYVSIKNIGLTTVSTMAQKATSKLPSWELPTYELPSLDIANTSPFVYGTIILTGFLVIEILILKRKYKW